MEPNLPYMCYTIQHQLQELFDVFQREMEADAFKTSDFETLRIEYAHLNKLLTRVKNEAERFDR